MSELQPLVRISWGIEETDVAFPSNSNLELPKQVSSLFRTFPHFLLPLAESIGPFVSRFNDERHMQVETKQPFKCTIYFTDEPREEAACAFVKDRHFVYLGFDFLERLAWNSVKFAEAVVKRREIDFGALIKEKADAFLLELRDRLQLDDTLTSLSPLDDTQRAELKTRMIQWPNVRLDEETPALIEFTLFHDLLRLVVMHELAHCVLGHCVFFQKQLGINAMREFDPSRVGRPIHHVIPVPRSHVMQAMEAHADEFAVRWIANQVIVGQDSAGAIFPQPLDLGERLALFNLAEAIFAVRTEMIDFRLTLGATFSIRPSDLTEENPFDEDGPDVILSQRTPFKVTPSSHPPAQLRFRRHLGFVYIMSVDSHSRDLLKTVNIKTDVYIRDFIGRVSKHIYTLVPLLPGPVRDWDAQRLDSYGAYLAELSEQLSPFVKEYLPSSATTTPEPAECKSTKPPMTTLELAEREPTGTLPDTEIDPAMLNNLLTLAHHSLVDGNLDDARSILHGVIVLDRQSASAWSLLGQVERDAGRYRDAKAAFEFALSLNPVDAKVARDLDYVNQLL